KCNDPIYLLFTPQIPRSQAHNDQTSLCPQDVIRINQNYQEVKYTIFPQFIIDEINTSLAKIKKLTDIDIQLLSQNALDTNTYPDSIQAITGLKNTIYLARNLELENEKKETINRAILR
ncbi:9697_t:CDS:1, partial [Gigaspora margarita]